MLNLVGKRYKRDCVAERYADRDDEFKSKVVTRVVSPKKPGSRRKKGTKINKLRGQIQRELCKVMDTLGRTKPVWQGTKETGEYGTD